MQAAAIPRPALLATIFVFNFIEFLQSGMVVFAAAPTMGQVGASPEEYALVTSLYAAVAVLSISQLTVLVQRLGWRDYLLASALLCAAGAWTCAASDTLAGFGAGRVLMAAGGGVFMSAARMLVNLIPPSPARFFGIAAFAGALSSGLALSSWLAAAMIGREAWSGIFLLLALLALLAGALALRWLPRDAATLDGAPVRFAPFDALALGGGVFLVLYGLQRLAYDWHGRRADVVLLLACGAGLAALFHAGQRRRPDAFLRLHILRNPRYLTGLAIFTFCYMALGVFNAVLPQLLQRVLGIAIVQAGQLQAAGMALALPVFACMLAVVRKRPHATKFYLAGFLALAAFGWRFSRLDPGVPAWTGIAPWIGLFGAFVFMSMATTALHGFKDFQQDNVLFAHAQQFKNMLGQVGIALGAGVGALLLQERGALHGARLAEGASAAPALLVQQGGLLAGLDVFQLLAWAGVAGAVLLSMQRRFD